MGLFVPIAKDTNKYIRNKWKVGIRSNDHVGDDDENNLSTA